MSKHGVLETGRCLWQARSFKHDPFLNGQFSNRKERRCIETLGRPGLFDLSENGAERRSAVGNMPAGGEA